jgi:hypothetical protein
MDAAVEVHSATCIALVPLFSRCRERMGRMCRNTPRALVAAPLLALAAGASAQTAAAPIAPARTAAAPAAADAGASAASSPTPTAPAPSADSSAVLTPGLRAISLAVPYGGGTTFGLWKVVAPGQARGLFLTGDATIEHAGSTTGYETSLSVGPRFRRYVRTAGRVLPFGQIGLGLGGGYGRTESEGVAQGHSWTASASLDGGIGAEWFPVPRASLSAFTGARLSWSATWPSGGATAWKGQLTTSSSNIALQFYF